MALRAASDSLWRESVRRVVEHGPVLDVGTPSRFFKALEWLEPDCATPYFCSDIRHTLTVDFAADARDLPVRSDSLGAVICQGVAQYVPDPQRMIDELHRVLRPGGRAYVGLTSVGPYTAAYPGFLGDVVRFTPQSPAVFFAKWSDIQVLRGGGAAHTASDVRTATVPATVHRVGGPRRPPRPDERHADPLRVRGEVDDARPDLRNNAVRLCHAL